MAKKHLLYIHDDRFSLEPNKSALVNKLLEKHYSPTPYDAMPKVAEFTEKDTKPLLNIPGVVRASDARCKGTHYMSRADCGKAGCPWG